MIKCFHTLSILPTRHRTGSTPAAARSRFARVPYSPTRHTYRTLLTSYTDTHRVTYTLHARYAKAVHARPLGRCCCL